jgi:type II secretory pathway component PulC
VPAPEIKEPANRDSVIFSNDGEEEEQEEEEEEEEKKSGDSDEDASELND